jgi:pyruvate-formate lyase
MNADTSSTIETHESNSRADARLTSYVQTRRCLKAVDRMKSFLFNAPQKVDVERLHFLLETYEESSHEPVIILRAKIFENLLYNKKLFIDDNPIVGTVTSQPAGVYIYPEWDSNWIIQEMNQAMMSHLGKVGITDEEKKIMRRAAKFFKNRSATAKAHEMSRQILGYDPNDDIKAGLFTETTTYTVGAGNVDYASFINRGLGDIIRETEKRLLNLPLTRDNSSRIDFYRAALISMRALVHLANRYATLAREMASQTYDQERRAELLEIAEICHRVPENPPRSFREAIQSWWFLHLGVQIEQSGCGSSPGRLGQYLDHYYQSDKAAGMSREDAIAWLKCLFVKIAEYGYYQGISYSRLTSGHTGHTINIGGLKANGDDATLELDYLLLETQIDLRNIQPTITLLYHDKLKEDFLLKAVELDRTGIGAAAVDE